MALSYLRALKKQARDEPRKHRKKERNRSREIPWGTRAGHIRHPENYASDRGSLRDYINACGEGRGNGRTQALLGGKKPGCSFQNKKKVGKRALNEGGSGVKDIKRGVAERLKIEKVDGGPAFSKKERHCFANSVGVEKGEGGRRIQPQNKRTRP